jgi:hypothetical protein
MKRFLASLVFVLMLWSLSGQAEGALTDGLAGSWQLDGNGNDSSGNGNNGQVFNATPTQDRFGNASGAMLFNGSNSYIQIPNAPDLNPTTAITVTAWFKADSFDLGSYSFPSLVRKNDPIGYPEANGYVLECDGIVQGQPGITFGTYLEGHGIYYVGASPFGLPVNTDTWYFVAAVYDGNNVSLYSGHDNQPLVAQSSPASGDIVPASSDLYIGEDPWKPYEDRYFNGAIDDVRVYDRALSPDEVNQLYSGTVPEPTTLIIWSLLGGLGIAVGRWRSKRAA